MREIVGVIADVKQSGLGAEAAPEVVCPFSPEPVPNYVYRSTHCK